MTMTHVNDGIFEALFASPLQPSDKPTAETVSEAIGSTLRRLGAAGCTSHTAEEFGNHPEEAAERMRWVRGISDRCCCLNLPTAPPKTTASAGTDFLPVRVAA